MITCKEDLMNTYIVKGNEALTKAYLGACKEYVDVYALMCDRWPEDCHLYFNPEHKHIQSGECDTSKYKEITLKDLVKPKPTKFVKVEESIFDLKEEFENGELYSSDCEGCYNQILGEKSLHWAGSQGKIYRQVEIDWRDEVVSFLDDENIGSGGVMTGDILNALLEVDWGCIKESDFIGLCHLVASLTEKPEGVLC
ncbi:hypothetical protein VPHK392_0014 [Vibrio phage K392]